MPHQPVHDACASRRAELHAAGLIVQQRAHLRGEVVRVRVGGVDRGILTQALHLGQRELHYRSPHGHVLEHLPHCGTVVHLVALVDVDAYVGGGQVGSDELVADTLRHLDILLEPLTAHLLAQLVVGIAGTHEGEGDVVSAAL